MITFARRRLRNSLITGGLLLACGAFYLSYLATQARPEFLTGWALFILIFTLAAYNIRKRLSMLPLGVAAHWLQLHAYLGGVAVLIFIVHTGWWWSGGALEGLLYLAFVLTAGSGLLGLYLSRRLPARLTRRGEEVIYERIPGFMARLRSEAESTVLQTAEEARSSTLPDFYNRELADFFSGPRHFWAHLRGTGRPTFMLTQRLNGLRRYLGDSEREAHERLLMLVERKDELDFHYALQSALKWWLLLHVPATAAMLILSLVHLVLVYAFTA